jgi:hypothetical protein
MYYKEITFTVIKEFLRHKTQPSKLCVKAARCLCILLNAFYAYPNYKNCMFLSWDSILSFFSYRYSYIMQDIENLRTKSESSKNLYNTQMLDYLKKEILLQTDNDSIGDSPKISNLIYKPIFCFTFYLLSYLNLRSISEKYKK